MKFIEIIDKFKENQDIASDTALAKFLKISRNGLIQIKNGEGGLKDQTIEKLMDGTGLEAWEIVAAWEAEHGRTKKVRKSWKKFQKIAVNCILCKIRPLRGIHPRWPMKKKKAA